MPDTETTLMPIDPMHGGGGYCCDSCTPMPRVTSLPAEELLPPELHERTLRDLDKDQLIAVINKLCHDWQFINQVYNDRAVNNGWCSEYEQRQTHYNGKMLLLRLHGRRSGLLGSWRDQAPDKNLEGTAKPGL